MASSSSYRQLVLFDCDDHRLSLFKDHEKYLSQLPPNAECYIFWNELQLRVYKKLEQLFKKYSNMHLCPSYCHEMEASSSSDLLSFLHELINKFSFVLIVHGNDQSNGNIVKRVAGSYGTKKLELKAIEEPFSQYLPDIVNRLRKKNRQYIYHEYLKRLSPKEQLKHSRPFFFSDSTWNYNSSRIPYDLEQNVSFKYLIKQKQKSLKAYYSNTCICKSTKFLAELDEPCEDDNDDYSSTMCEQMQSSGLEFNYQSTFLLLSPYSKWLKRPVTVRRHFDEKPGKSVRFNTIEPTTHKKSSKRTKSAKSYTRHTKAMSINATSNPEMMQEQMKSAESADEFIKKSPHYSQCTKKFSSRTAFKQHFADEHARDVADNLFFCSQCSEKFKSITARDIHSSAKHAQSNFTIYTEPWNPLDSRSTMPKAQTKATQHKTSSIKTLSCWKCTKKFRSTRQRLTHFIENHAISIRSKIKELSAYANDHISVPQNQINGATTATNSIKRSFGCWQCTCKLASHEGLINHFIDKHAGFILSTDTDPSSLLESQLTIAQERMKKKENTAISTAISFGRSLGALDITQPISVTETQFVVNQEQKKSVARDGTGTPLLFDSSQCAVKFESVARRDLHLATTHFKPSNTPDDLKISTQKQVKIGQQASDPINKFACWQCSKKFATAPSRLDHFINQHTTSCQSDHGTPSMQEKMNSAKRTNIPVSKPRNCWQCVKKFKADRDLFAHFVHKHASFILTTDTDPSSIFRNQITRTQERIDATQSAGVSMVAPYNWSQQLIKSKSDDDACISPFSPKQAGSHVSTFTPVLNPFNSEMAAIPKHKRIKESITNSTTPSSKHSRRLEMFKLDLDQTGFIISEDVNASRFHNNKSTTMSDQTNITKHTDSSSKTYFCWHCSKKFKSAQDHLHHLSGSHSASFLPTTRQQMSSGDIAIEPLSESYWEFGKKFRSYSHHMPPFINKHAKTIVSMDTDPSGALRNQITIGQERMKATSAPIGCSQSSKNFKSAADYSNHSNSKHLRSTTHTASKLSKPLADQRKAIKEQMNTVKSAAHSVDLSLTGSKCLQDLSSDPSERCQKDSKGGVDHLKHSITKHTAMKSDVAALGEFINDSAAMKCPKAKHPTLVYMSSRTIRKQICTTFNKTNRCPHDSCESKTDSYEFQELWSHIISQHKDTQFTLECCDPTIMYTPEEYKNHRLHSN